MKKYYSNVKVILLSITFFFVSCNKSDEESQPPLAFDEIIFSADLPDILPAQQQTVYISFTSNKPWTITDLSGDWYDISPLEGSAGSATISIKVSENKNFLARNMAFSVTAGDTKKRIYIGQDNQVGGDEIIELPDPIFKQWMLARFDANNDGQISRKEASFVYEIDFLWDGEGETDFTSLQGIEHCFNLRTLRCIWGKLQQLDVSQNTELEILDIPHNYLSKLDVSNNTKLKYLDCGGNDLTELDVTQNVDLEHLSCGFAGWRWNSLATLDVTQNTKLKELRCDNGLFEEIDLSNNTELEVLICGDGKLKTLDVSNNQMLCDLRCGSSWLKKLDVSHHSRLFLLYCFDNELTELNLEGCTALQYLDCGYNNLTYLDVSDSSIKVLICRNIPSLETLCLKTGWKILGINQGRDINYIPLQTEILYKN